MSLQASKRRRPKLAGVVLVVCAATVLGSAPAPAATPTPELDQSLVSPSDLGAAINDCCNYIGQTFTAGRDGLLAEVRIDTYAANDLALGVPLRVSIRNAENGLPGQTVLAETVLASPIAPLSQAITFPQAVQIRSGTQYAIVVNLEDPPRFAQAAWNGATGDRYPGGDECYSFDDGLAWACYADEGFDLRFQTYLLPPTPTSKDQCKNGGWRNFPQFQNQLQCNLFVDRTCGERGRFEPKPKYCPVRLPNR